MVSDEGFETWDERSSHLPAADRRSGSPDPARLAAGAANVLYGSQLPPLPMETRLKVITRTVQETPPNATHWSRSLMAEAMGISPSSVGG